MRRHATDMVSLALGIVFFVVVAVWALAKSVTVDLPSGGWVVAGALIVLGLAGVVAAVRPRKS